MLLSLPLYLLWVLSDVLGELVERGGR